MEEKTFWVGDRPSGATVFQIRSKSAGVPESLTSFHTARTLILDSDDRILEFPAENTVITNAVGGEVTFFWPSESIFTKPGRYVMQVELEGNTVTKRTSVQYIRIREIGGAFK